MHSSKINFSRCSAALYFRSEFKAKEESVKNSWPGNTQKKKRSGELLFTDPKIIHQVLMNQVNYNNLYVVLLSILFSALTEESLISLRGKAELLC